MTTAATRRGRSSGHDPQGCRYPSAKSDHRIDDPPTRIRLAPARAEDLCQRAPADRSLTAVTGTYQSGTGRQRRRNEPARAAVSPQEWNELLGAPAVVEVAGKVPDEELLLDGDTPPIRSGEQTGDRREGEQTT